MMRRALAGDKFALLDLLVDFPEPEDVFKARWAAVLQAVTPPGRSAEGIKDVVLRLTDALACRWACVDTEGGSYDLDCKVDERIPRLHVLSTPLDDWRCNGE